MDKISDVSVEVCENSKFVQPFSVKYKQNGVAKNWDCVRIHDSVAILIFNSTKNVFVLVRQFRPAVYMSQHRSLWENDKIFSTSLSHLDSPPKSTDRLARDMSRDYGPGSMGCTYELCAGIVDKSLSLQQIAIEEIKEETGYHVTEENLELITSFYSSVGHAGSVQTLFYCEVTDNMRKTDGGGNLTEGEYIQVVHVPLEEGTSMILHTERPRPAGLCFALMWFEHHKKPLCLKN